MEELGDGSLCWVSGAAGCVVSDVVAGRLLWVFVEYVCSKPCCSGVRFVVCVMCVLPSCFDVSLHWLCCFGVLSCYCCWCCFESAVAWCAVVLWVFAGRLEVSSHKVVRASVYESAVSCMCVDLCCAFAMLAVRCALSVVLCAVG